MKHPGYCPDCGERVTPFAAGCALCGADLDPHRWDRPPSFVDRLTVKLPRLRSGEWFATRARTRPRVRVRGQH
jgi:hypothetical protein